MLSTMRPKSTTDTLSHYLVADMSGRVTDSYAEEGEQ